MTPQDFFCLKDIGVAIKLQYTFLWGQLQEIGEVSGPVLIEMEYRYDVFLGKSWNNLLHEWEGELFKKLIKDNKNLSVDDRQVLIGSAVGDGIAREFSAFLKLSHKIDLKKILEKPQMVADIKEIDLKYSLLSAIVEKYREDKKVLDKVLAVCNYLEPEFAILQLRYLKSARKEFVNEVVKVGVWKELSTKYSRYLLDLKDGD